MCNTGNFAFRCEVEIWNKPSPIPRDELLKRIKGKSGIYCMLTEKLNAEFFNAAGKVFCYSFFFMFCY